MGIVYKARDPNIDRFVAIKTVSLAGQEREEKTAYRERFFQEARAAGRLSHPGIVTIFDVGEEPVQHDPYIVMEYVPGEALSRKLGQKRTLPAEVALRLAQELSEALECAHNEGVVHRDIKPANILLTDGEHAKITDFGIAKLHKSHLTLPGEVLGSPAYMAPEQLSGTNVDARSDLFSVGVVLYSMLVGFRPFQGDSATSVCFKVVHSTPVPVSAINTDLSPKIDWIISKAMSKDPDQRFQTGGEMAAAIRELMEFLSDRSETVALSCASCQGNTTKRVGIASLHSSDQGRVPQTQRLPKTMGLVAALVLFFILSISWGRRRIDQVPTLTGLSAPTPAARNSAAPGTATKSPAEAAGKTENGPLTNAALSSSAATAPQDVLKEKKKAPAVKLGLELQHQFSRATASVWVDGKLTYTTELRGASKGVIFRKTRGSASGTFMVAQGTHQIRVRVTSTADNFDQSQSVRARFEAGTQPTLRVACDKRHRNLRLAVD